MRIIEADTQNALPLGRQGEKGVTTVAFDVHGWLEEFGAGTFVLLHKRNGDDAGYPVKTVLEDGKVLWTVDEADVFRPGTGVAQLIMMVDGKVAKSGLYKTSTSQALNETSKPPEAWKAWVDSIFEAVGTYPRINTVGNWEVFEGGAWKDTGVSAKGKVPVKGVDYFDGHTPVMTGVKEGKTNTILADGVPLISIKDAEGGAVTEDAITEALGYKPADPAEIPEPVDVRINGTSIVQDGVAEITTNPTYGTTAEDKQIRIIGCSENDISNRAASSSRYKPVTLQRLDSAVKSALTDGKGVAYSDAERKAGRERLGIGSYELIVDTTLENEVNEITFSKWSDNTDMNAKKLCVYIIVPITPAAAKSMYPYFKTDATTSSGLGVNSFTYSSTAYPYCINFNMQVEDGLCFGERNIHSNYTGGNSVTSSTAAFIVSSNELQNIDKNNYIISARFRGRNVGADDFPVGTRFILFGVRA